jgi:hypothetical protein
MSYLKVEEEEGEEEAVVVLASLLNLYSYKVMNVSTVIHFTTCRYVGTT